MKHELRDYLTKQEFDDVRDIADTAIPWEQLRGKTVLVTGANGFIAYYLILALLIRNDFYGNNIKIIGMVRNSGKAEQKYGSILKRTDFTLLQQDVCESLENCGDVDYIIHAASQASPYYFENDPVGTLEANTIGTSNLLKYAVGKKQCQVLVVSSLKVYGEVKNGLGSIREEDIGSLEIDNYQNCYAQGKRVAETLCNCYVKQYGLQVKIARPSYIYGASTLRDDRVWAQFFKNVIQKENILLKSNGAQYRSFCYVTDTVAALLYILLYGEAGVPYNIAYEKSNTTIRNFAKTVAEAFPERRIRLVFQNKVDEKESAILPGDKTPEILDSTRLHGLGWEGRVDLMEGVRRSIQTMEERMMYNK